MAHVPSEPDSDADPGAGAGVASDMGPVPPRAPRWVKVSAIVVGVLVLLVAIVLLTGLGGGSHGPARHTGSGDTQPAGVTAVQAWSGGHG